MSNGEICTQYRLIVALLKKGCADEVIEILQEAVERLQSGTNGRTA
ncbi:MAG: hypothetical protein NC078_01990 [Ruminococcus sp.]|nr:hypothetical protein [Ruminococcus sp.]